MKVLAIVPAIYDTSPGQRFRMEQWEPFLREQNIEITWSPFEDHDLHAVMGKPGKVFSKIAGILRGSFRRLDDSLRAGNYDVLYVLREAALLGPAFFERLWKICGARIVFDFDDAVFVRYVSPAHGYLSYLKFPGKTATNCRLSSHVMAGNQYLADYARQYCQKVSIVPTTIDTDKYHTVAQAENTIPVIGWSGSFSTVQHLDTLRGALQKLARESHFKLRVIGTPRYELSGVEVEAMSWCASTEVEDLSMMDVGIMPLPDEPWSRGKCGLKALQYMALGIPTICSPVGVNTEIIQDGMNGFIAVTEDEWVAKLKQMLADSALRKRLGTAGKSTVAEKYSARAVAPKVAEIFLSLTQS